MFDPRTKEGVRLAAAEVEARAEIRRCVVLVETRADENHPATQAWRDAIARWHIALGRVYPEEFLSALAALKQTPSRETGAREWVWSRAPPESIEIGIRFLEADLVCFRSGYFKERLFRYLARQQLGDDDRRRLRAVVLASLLGPVRREFRAVCTLAASVADEDLLVRVDGLAGSVEDVTARRAGLLHAAIMSARRGYRRRPGAG